MLVNLCLQQGRPSMSYAELLEGDVVEVVEGVLQVVGSVLCGVCFSLIAIRFD